MGIERDDLSMSGKITGLRKAKRPLQSGNELSRGRQLGMVWTRGRVRGLWCLPPSHSKGPTQAKLGPIHSSLSVGKALCLHSSPPSSAIVLNPTMSHTLHWLSNKSNCSKLLCHVSHCTIQL